MNIELVTIGDELLLGLTIDTNAAWLARALAADGVRIVRRATVGDEADHIVSAVRDALDRTGGVITTGGLGPTADDLTKPSIAALFGREMLFDAERWEALKRLWRERGRPGELPESNRQQVMIPAGAHVLNNRHGTAPGIFLEDERGRWVAMLPGVPREMRGLFDDELREVVLARLHGDRQVIRSQIVRTTGVSESLLPELLGDAARGLDGMSLAYLPGQEGVDLRLTIRGTSAAEADARLAAGAQIVAARVGTYVYARGAPDLAEVVLSACREAQHRLAVAESCTGGLLGARLTAIPGASDVVLGGVIAYDNVVKRELLGVPEAMLIAKGAVSDEAARAMAAGVRQLLDADIGVGITGVAGPGGGSEEKPVGLVYIAVDCRGAVTTFGGKLIGDREEVRFRATQVALELVRRALHAAG
ncbi:MAG: competence/damage-inducible protein A [Gemmatimonadaceae bacterium]